jgi:hypothetical protein
MRSALMHSVREALNRPWVLDLDATIKPLYGRQEGAQIGYWSWSCPVPVDGCGLESQV